MKNLCESRVQVNKDDLSALKPRITQYKGTVFKSKSEAVFARCLDLAGVDWLYEPFDGKDDPPGGHQWDFLLFMTFQYVPGTKCGNHQFVLHGDNYSYTQPYLIEYKPKAPNHAYYESLVSGLRAWDGSDKCDDELEFAVVHGSPWDSGRYEMNPVFRNNRPYIRPGESWHELVGCPVAMRDISTCITEALRYRFDICGSIREQKIEYL